MAENCRAGHKPTSGFTVLELLVVVSIVGMLSAMILVSLSNLRTKSKNVAIKADMAQIRNRAATILTDVGVLNNFCPDAETVAMRDHIRALSDGVTTACAVTSSDFRVVSRLSGNEGLASGWCVDTLGNSTGVIITLGGPPTSRFVSTVGALDGTPALAPAGNFAPCPI